MEKKDDLKKILLELSDIFKKVFEIGKDGKISIHEIPMVVSLVFRLVVLLRDSISIVRELRRTGAIDNLAFRLNQELPSNLSDSDLLSYSLFFVEAIQIEKGTKTNES